jgi:hypothetical protein
MDSQVIIAIITGVFGAIVTPTMSQFIPRLFRGPRIMDSKPHIVLPAVIGGLVGVLLGFFLISPIFNTPCSITSPTSVTIVSPPSGISVPRLVTVQGTSCHLSNDKELWLMVVPDGVTSYYPQPGPITVAANGNWSATAYLGLESSVDVGKGFVVIAAQVDAQAVPFVRTYFTQPGPEIKGLEPLPQGVQLMSQIKFVRK